MNKEDPYRYQAEKRRQRLTPANFEEGQAVDREELPPRNRVHQQKRKKNKWKLKYPMIRLLVLFFILLPITIYSIYSTVVKDKLGEAEPVVGESTDGFEFIDIEADEETDSSKEEPAVEETEENMELTGDEQNDGMNEGVEQEDVSGQGEDITFLITGSDASSNQAEQKGTVYHTVKPDETIYKISMMYYKSKAGIEMIKVANNLTSNDIKVGQVLTIPLNK